MLLSQVADQAVGRETAPTGAPIPAPVCMIRLSLSLSLRFLCDAEGLPVKRFAPDESPLTFERDIVTLLK